MSTLMLPESLLVRPTMSNPVPVKLNLAFVVDPFPSTIETVPLLSLESPS